MRIKLAPMAGQLHLFFATFRRYGSRWGWHGNAGSTVLLENVLSAEGSLLTNHIWFEDSRPFEDVQPAPGDQVVFYAEVHPYIKGYRGADRHNSVRSPAVDYAFARVADVQIIGEDKSEADEW